MSAKAILPLLAGMFWIGCLLTGCQSPQPPPAVARSLSTRNNCYSLLHQLLAQQKDVSLLRFIKKEPSDVKTLVKRIAKASGAAADLLEKFAKEDSTIRLDDFRLPPGEVATRASIAKGKEKELLGQSGDKFDLTLLLTQTEALSYAWNLAKITAENEPQPDRARALLSISEDMQRLYREVFALLLSERKAS